MERGKLSEEEELDILEQRRDEQKEEQKWRNLASLIRKKKLSRIEEE